MRIALIILRFQGISNLKKTLVLCPTDPERWTNIPLLVKILKLIINELSNAMEANASRQTAADWSQGTMLV